MPSIEPSRRALIVVDVQNDYDGGNLAIEHPPFNDTLRQVARAMDEATARGIKVVVIKMITPPTAPVFRPGTRGAELHPEIALRPHDHGFNSNPVTEAHRPPGISRSLLPRFHHQAGPIRHRGPAAAVERFAASEGYELLQEFVEVETGKGADALD